MSLHRPFVVVCAVTFLLCLISFQSEAAQPHRQFVSGYAEAVLHLVLGLKSAVVEIDKTTAIVRGNLSEADRETVRARLKEIDGIEVVEFPPAKVADTNADKTTDEDNSAGADAKPEYWTKRLLFPPLIADLRAPRFSVAWQFYRSNNSLTNVGAVSFGETLTIADVPGQKANRQNLRNGDHEYNLQGAVFSIFDMDGTSKDLVNTDFWIAGTRSYRKRYGEGDFSYMTRLFHQSSHLGDEYILFNKITDRDRVNLSYEGLDLTLAFEPKAVAGSRLFFGGGMLLRREPASLDRWSAKAGGEWVSPEKHGWGYPIVAGHFQAYGQNDWETDVSLATGFQVGDPHTNGHQIRFLASYFNGYSPNGQFYEEELKYFSLSAQYQF